MTDQGSANDGAVRESSGAGGIDPEIDAWLDDYREANENGDEAELVRIADRIKAKQRKLIDEEGHSGIGAPTVEKDGTSGEDG